MDSEVSLDTRNSLKFLSILDKFWTGQSNITRRTILSRDKCGINFEEIVCLQGSSVKNTYPSSRKYDS